MRHRTPGRRGSSAARLNMKLGNRITEGPLHRDEVPAGLEAVRGQKIMCSHVRADGECGEVGWRKRSRLDSRGPIVVVLMAETLGATGGSRHSICRARISEAGARTRRTRTARQS